MASTQLLSGDNRSPFSSRGLFGRLLRSEDNPQITGAGNDVLCNHKAFVGASAVQWRPIALADVLTD